jgi:hypothetical protein
MVDLVAQAELVVKEVQVQLVNPLRYTFKAALLW